MSHNLYLRRSIKLPGDCPLEWQEAADYSGAVLEGASTHTSYLSKAKAFCFMLTREEFSIPLSSHLSRVPHYAREWAGLAVCGQEQLSSELGRACIDFLLCSGCLDILNFWSGDPFFLCCTELSPGCEGRHLYRWLFNIDTPLILFLAALSLLLSTGLTYKFRFFLDVY